jgi:hypothetical protein
MLQLADRDIFVMVRRRLAGGLAMKFHSTASASAARN